MQGHATMKVSKTDDGHYVGPPSGMPLLEGQQPGMMQLGMMQPGMMQPGMMQPGMM